MINIKRLAEGTAMTSMKDKKVHFVGYIPAGENFGWADCGRLVHITDSYDEDMPGRNEVTCKKCQSAR